VIPIPRTAALLLALETAVLLGGAACGKTDRPRIPLPSVGGLQTRLAPRYSPPASGEISPAQIDLYLRVRRAGRHGSDIDAARDLGIDPVEYVWVRSRVLEALAYLDAKRVQDGATEAYTRSVAVLREARKETGDAKTAARLDSELSAVERERASARRVDPALSAGARNAVRVAERRAEIDAVAP